MDFVAVVLSFVTFALVMIILHLINENRRSTQQFIDVLIAERAPTYTRIAQAEKLAEQALIISEIETDDEDDYPEGIIN